MTTTALIEAPRSADALGNQARESLVPDAGERLAGLPPLLSVVPQAGPAVFVYVGFGFVLLLLLVPPITLVVTLMGVMLLGAAALVALVTLVAAALAAPFLLVRRLHAHPPRPFSLPVPRLRELKVRRV
jgi:hypothetical protein